MDQNQKLWVRYSLIFCWFIIFDSAVWSIYDCYSFSLPLVERTSSSVGLASLSGKYDFRVLLWSFNQRHWWRVHRSGRVKRHSRVARKSMSVLFAKWKRFQIVETKIRFLCVDRTQLGCVTGSLRYSAHQSIGLPSWLAHTNSYRSPIQSIPFCQRLSEHRIMATCYPPRYTLGVHHHSARFHLSC